MLTNGIAILCCRFPFGHGLHKAYCLLAEQIAGRAKHAYVADAAVLLDNEGEVHRALDFLAFGILWIMYVSVQESV